MAHQGARQCCRTRGSFALNAAWMFEIALALLSQGTPQGKNNVKIRLC